MNAVSFAFMPSMGLGANFAFVERQTERETVEPPPMARPPPVAPASSVTLREAMLTTLTAKTRAGCRPAYLVSLRQYLTLFIRGRENTPIADIRVSDLEDWWTWRHEALNSEASNRGRLSAMFQLCYRKGWINDNPLRRLEKLHHDRKPPQILTVEQARKALAWAKHQRPHMMADLVLGLFAGVRPVERLKLTWDAVDLERGIVIIAAEASKVRQRRIVELQPTALEWLKLAREKNAVLPIKPMTARRRRWLLAQAVGFETWPQDILRHTAASYLLASIPDVPRVARWLGNSPGILLNHYCELINKEEAALFWALTPASI